jgi:hypothetical protein
MNTDKTKSSLHFPLNGEDEWEIGDGIAGIQTAGSGADEEQRQHPRVGAEFLSALIGGQLF